MFAQRDKLDLAPDSLWRTVSARLELQIAIDGEPPHGGKVVGGGLRTPRHCRGKEVAQQHVDPRTVWELTLSLLQGEVGCYEPALLEAAVDVAEA